MSLGRHAPTCLSSPLPCHYLPCLLPPFSPPIHLSLFKHVHGCILALYSCATLLAGWDKQHASGWLNTCWFCLTFYFATTSFIKTCFRFSFWQCGSGDRGRWTFWFGDRARSSCFNLALPHCVLWTFCQSPFSSLLQGRTCFPPVCLPTCLCACGISALSFLPSPNLYSPSLPHHSVLPFNSLPPSAGCAAGKDSM